MAEDAKVTADVLLAAFYRVGSEILADRLDLARDAADSLRRMVSLHISCANLERSLAALVEGIDADRTQAFDGFCQTTILLMSHIRREDFAAAA